LENPSGSASFGLFVKRLLPIPFLPAKNLIAVE